MKKLVGAIILLFISCYEQKELKFELIPNATVDRNVDFSHVTINSLNENFVVINFSKTSLNYKKIDSFLLERQKLNSDRDWYKAHFFKESKETNVSNINNNRDIIDDYSMWNDLIYAYKWNNGLHPEKIQKYFIKRGSKVVVKEYLDCLK